MYAIFENGSRQYKVEVGKEILIDYRGEVEAGTQYESDKVLAISSEESVQIGAPYLDGATVSFEVIKAVKGPKLVVCKFRRRKNSKRRTGHRQIYTLVKINSITTG